MNNNDIDPDMLADFLDEAEIHISVLNQQLLLAEQQKPTSEQIDELFRAAHSLKGAAGFLNLNEITEVTHRLETLLDHLRNGQRDLDQSVLEVLFSACDGITSLVAQQSNPNAEAYDANPLVEQLNATISGGSRSNQRNQPDQTGFFFAPNTR